MAILSGNSETFGWWWCACWLGLACAMGTRNWMPKTLKEWPYQCLWRVESSLVFSGRLKGNVMDEIIWSLWLGYTCRAPIILVALKEVWLTVSRFCLWCHEAHSNPLQTLWWGGHWTHEPYKQDGWAQWPNGSTSQSGDGSSGRNGLPYRSAFWKSSSGYNPEELKKLLLSTGTLRRIFKRKSFLLWRRKLYILQAWAWSVLLALALRVPTQCDRSGYNRSEARNHRPEREWWDHDGWFRILAPLAETHGPLTKPNSLWNLSRP